MSDGRLEERDLLSELARGDLTEAQAYRVLDDVRERSVLPKSLELVGFSPAEWTACAKGLPLSVLVDWRELGWPADCLRCGIDVDPDGLHWRVVKDPGDESGYGLEHLECL
ncbi:MAG: hypothetical protein AAFZ65_00360 [Planctomycetota bacterium]